MSTRTALAAAVVFFWGMRLLFGGCLTCYFDCPCTVKDEYGACGLLFDGKTGSRAKKIVWKQQKSGIGVTVALPKKVPISRIVVATSDPDRKLDWLQSETRFQVWDGESCQWKLLASVSDVTGKSGIPGFAKSNIITSWNGAPIEASIIRVLFKGKRLMLAELGIFAMTADGREVSLSPYRPLSVDMDETEEVRASGTGDYAFGSSMHMESWWAGEDDSNLKGLAQNIGNLNLLNHRFRGLAKFDISRYIPRGKVRAATLRLCYKDVFGKRDTRILGLDHLLREKKLFMWSDILDSDSESIMEFAFVKSSMSPPREVYIDVTEQVNSDLVRGYSYAAFRLRDVIAEKEGNPDNAASGLVFDIKKFALLIIK